MKTTKTFEVKIYIAGDVHTIETACRKFCLSGLCVTITPTDFIFTGGMESGAVIGLINYARFPAKPSSITQKAFDLANLLMVEAAQRSCSVVTLKKTHYLENESVSIPR